MNTYANYSMGGVVDTNSSHESYMVAPAKRKQAFLKLAWQKIIGEKHFYVY